MLPALAFPPVPAFLFYFTSPFYTAPTPAILSVIPSAPAPSALLVKEAKFYLADSHIVDSSLTLQWLIHPSPHPTAPPWPLAGGAQRPRRDQEGE